MSVLRLCSYGFIGIREAIAIAELCSLWVVVYMIECQEQENSTDRS
jgi:hypothetical protein